VFQDERTEKMWAKYYYTDGLPHRLIDQIIILRPKPVPTSRQRVRLCDHQIIIIIIIIITTTFSRQVNGTVWLLMVRRLDRYGYYHWPVRVIINYITRRNDSKSGRRKLRGRTAL